MTATNFNVSSGELRTSVNAIAAAQAGISISEFNALSSTEQKMAHDRVVEYVKTIRHATRQSIRTVIDDMIEHMNNGMSVEYTIKKILEGGVKS